MIKQEIYKLFIKRMFLPVLLTVLLLECFLAYNSAQGIKLDDRASQLKYEEYMNKFSGELTESKMNEIEKLIENNDKIIEERSETERKYIEREINDSEYTKYLKNYNEYMVGYGGFAAFIDAYSTAVEYEKSLIDEKPWDVLFKNESIDFLLVLLITMSVILLYVSDLESGTEPVTFSTENGKGKKTICQVVICAFISAFSCATIALLRYLIIGGIYGLKNPELSLKNILIFSESDYNLSLLQAYCVVSGIRIFGSIYLAVLTCFIGSVLKKSMLTGFTSFIIVFLPNYIAPDREYKYLLPLPSAFLTANGYLFGDIIYDEIFFKSITTLQYVFVFGVSAAIICLSFALAYIKTVRSKT